MTSAQELANDIGGLRRLEARYKEEALQRAKDRAAASRVEVYRKIKEAIDGGVKISAICREADVSRSTVYRWLDEIKEVDSVHEVDESDAWQVLHVAKVSGDVKAMDPSGNTWILNAESGEAWNQTANETVEPLEAWAPGARAAVDSVPSE